MTRDDLTALLARIASGDGDEGDVRRARALLRDDDRLPDEVRDGALLDDVEDEAASLLALLELDPLADDTPDVADPIDVVAGVFAAIGGDAATELDDWEPVAQLLRDAIAAEGGSYDGAPQSLASLGASEGADLASAVAEAAGEVDVADDVLVAIGARPATSLRDAVRAEAGDVDVSEAAMLAIGAPPALSWRDAVVAEAGSFDAAEDILAAIGGRSAWSLAEALRAEAGTVDVADAVLRAIGAAELGLGPALATAIEAEAGGVDVAVAVERALRPAAVVPVPAVAAPANSNRFFPALALLAAAALVAVVGIGRGFGGSTPEPLQFASAGEVTIENLSYSDDVMVNVIQGEGDAPLILWIDEEATL
jgi:hypothetical protein